MINSAVFPGSFDPITKGHESVVLRSLNLFDSVTVAIGFNAEKKYLFPVELRMQWLKDVFAPYPQVNVTFYEGLTTDFCKKHNLKYIIRGLRTSADFEFERSIGQMNKKIYPEIETVFMLALPEYNALSSSVLRDIYRNGGDIKQFIPEKIQLPDIK
ncbi:MAG: pantetheine-phosphate adenylyltransferase [Bacteroidales bacterium]|jgi:pantetheine-phosphate adenylyltransferase|nr:pantetheine-phosphate adenylyltransferase [Bacteroidales bacterium]MDD4214517.1 pantetheine-phosphate adenylyltransferase [Bacteroidales bacterium]